MDRRIFLGSVAALSETVHPIRGPRPASGAEAPPPVIEHGLGPHGERLDMLTGIFGKDRVVLGGDRPNAVDGSEVPHTVVLVRDISRGRAARRQRSYFGRTPSPPING